MNALTEWLQRLLHRLEMNELSREEYVLLLQHYAKDQLLHSSQPVEEDDWDWISVGLLLRQLCTSETA